MKSIIKFLLYFLAVVLVITWLVTIYKAGQEEIDPNTSVSDAMVEEVGMGEDEDVLAAMNDEELDEEYNNILNEAGTEEEEEVADDPDEAELDPMEYDDTDETISNNDPEEVASMPVSTTTDDRIVADHTENVPPYMVIVGSFLVPNNADKRKQEIAQMGFDAEVVNFDLSQYHTVLAGRYNSYADAQAAVKKLKAKGVDAYAKKREQ